MTCAVLSIGTELTRGEILNTNASWLASSLTDLGLTVTEIVTVDDHEERISAALDRLARTARVIVATGGLGPTTDDLTARSVAGFLGAPLERDVPSLDHIKRRLEQAGRPLTDSNAKQADVPRGAEVLPNAAGTAPGFSVRVRDVVAFFLPGVPREMERMFHEQVSSRVRQLATHDTYQIKLRTFGLPESTLGDKLAGIEESYPGVTIGYRADFPEVDVKVRATASNQAEARVLAERAIAEVRPRLAPWIYAEGEENFAAHVGRLLRSRGFTLALAESCTGGLMGHMLTIEPGASDFLLVDAVAYANSSKAKFLGVADDVLRWHGAVSPEVAAAMAEGVKRIAGADIGIGITGIAGPGGATDSKPIGLVYISSAGPSGTVVREHRFSGDRLQIQTRAAYTALQMVRTICLDVASTRELLK